MGDLTWLWISLVWSGLFAAYATVMFIIDGRQRRRRAEIAKKSLEWEDEALSVMREQQASIDNANRIMQDQQRLIGELLKALKAEKKSRWVKEGDGFDPEEIIPASILQSVGVASPRKQAIELARKVKAAGNVTAEDIIQFRMILNQLVLFQNYEAASDLRDAMQPYLTGQ